MPTRRHPKGLPGGRHPDLDKEEDEEEEADPMLLENLPADTDEQLSEGEVTPPDSPTLGDKGPAPSMQKRKDKDDNDKHDTGGHMEQHNGGTEGDQQNPTADTTAPEEQPSSNGQGQQPNFAAEQQAHAS